MHSPIKRNVPQQNTKARFSCLLQHPEWKRRDPILILALHKFVTYLLRHLPTYLQPRTYTSSFSHSIPAYAASLNDVKCPPDSLLHECHPSDKYTPACCGPRYRILCYQPCYNSLPPNTSKQTQNEFLWTTTNIAKCHCGVQICGKHQLCGRPEGIQHWASGRFKGHINSLFQCLVSWRIVT